MTDIPSLTTCIATKLIFTYYLRKCDDNHELDGVGSPLGINTRLKLVEHWDVLVSDALQSSNWPRWDHRDVCRVTALHAVFYSRLSDPLHLI